MSASKLVIFDCDGVLVDSEGTSNRVLAEALTAIGIPTSEADSQRRYRGKTLGDVERDAEQRLGTSLPEDFLERYEADRARAFEATLGPIAGAAQTVAAVTAAGWAVCVASQGKRSKTEHTLGITGLRDLFADGSIFSADDVDRGKPAPDLFLHAAATMGVAPERCTVVEDTVIGATAAQAARMRVFGLVEDGDPEPMRALGVPTLRRLPELLDVL